MNDQASSDENPSGVQGICPNGWHVPSDSELKELEIFLGMSQEDADAEEDRGTIEGSKLAGNASLWQNGDLKNDAEFDTSGFTALPWGYRYETGFFSSLSFGAYFWSATEFNSSSAWRRRLYYNKSSVYRDYVPESFGFSVRCVKDTSLIQSINTPDNLNLSPYSCDQINLSWTDNSDNETGFEIWSSLTSDNSYAVIDTTEANDTSYSDTGLDASTEYFYKIRAINDQTISEFTEVDSATTYGIPEAPDANDTSYCAGNEEAVLVANGDSINWYSDSDLTDTIFEGDTLYTGLTQEIDTTFYVTQTVNNCESLADTVILTIHAIPGQLSVADIEVCYDETVPDFSATGDSIRWYKYGMPDSLLFSGNTFDTGETEAGTYTYYVTETQNNCESLADTVILTIHAIPGQLSVADIEVCFGETVPDFFATGDNIRWYKDGTPDTLLFSGNTFTTDETETGSYTYYVTETQNNCESPADTVILTINPVYEIPIEAEICDGDIYNFFGAELTETGDYSDTPNSINGCDSIILLSLIVNPVYETPIEVEICNGESYDFLGTELTEAGDYSDTLNSINGCDSVILLSLIVNPIYETPIDAEICDGDSYDFLGTELTEAGDYSDTLNSINGCDSVILLSLIVNPIYETPIDAEICDEDSYDFLGTELTEAGDYSDTLYSINGCDSVIKLNLTVNPVYDIQIDSTICKGDTVLLGDSILTMPDTYKDTLHTIHGCDSLVEIILNVISVDTSVTQIGNILVANASSAFFQWIDCINNDSIIEGATQAGFVVPDSGSYAVIVTQKTQIECIDTSSCYELTVNVIENSFESSIRVYPNPVTNELSIDLNKIYIDILIQLFSINGEEIFREVYSQTRNININMSLIPKGMYLLTIQNNENRAMLKIVKNK